MNEDEDDAIHHLAREVHALHVTLEKGFTKMALIFERLEASVASIDTVIDSAVAAFTNLAEAVRDAVANAKTLAEAQAKAGALADDLDAHKDQLAAAVLASTTPVPVPDPVPVPTDPVTGQPVDPAAPIIDRSFRRGR